MIKSHSIVTLAAAAALTALLGTSCTKTLETTYSNQETKIATIADNLVSSAKDSTAAIYYRNGSTVATVVQGDGEELTADGAVSFYYGGYYISSTSLSSNTLFATNDSDLAAAAGWNLSDSTMFQIRTIDLSEDDSLVEGLRNGLIGARSGEECYVMFSGKHGFGKKKIGTVPMNAALAYHLWIVSVTN